MADLHQKLRFRLIRLLQLLHCVQLLRLIDKPEHMSVLLSVFDNILNTQFIDGISPVHQRLLPSHQGGNLRVISYIAVCADIRKQLVHPVICEDNHILLVQYNQPLISMVERIVNRRVQRTEIAVLQHRHHHAEHCDSHCDHDRVIAAEHADSL